MELSADDARRLLVETIRPQIMPLIMKRVYEKLDVEPPAVQWVAPPAVAGDFQSTLDYVRAQFDAMTLPPIYGYDRNPTVTVAQRREMYEKSLKAITPQRERPPKQLRAADIPLTTAAEVFDARRGLRTREERLSNVLVRPRRRDAEPQ